MKAESRARMGVQSGKGWEWPVKPGEGKEARPLRRNKYKVPLAREMIKQALASLK